MKIFISQPMKDRDRDRILEERAAIISAIREKYGDKAEIVNEKVPEFDGHAVKALSYSISLLADCDIAVFIAGYDKYRGCSIEHLICEKYSIATVILPYSIIS